MVDKEEEAEDGSKLSSLGVDNLYKRCILCKGNIVGRSRTRKGGGKKVIR